MSNVGKYKKKQAVLAARIKDWENGLSKKGAGFKKPGSQKGNWQKKGVVRGMHANPES